jgi:hypothetical protein
LLKSANPNRSFAKGLALDLACRRRAFRKSPEFISSAITGHSKVPALDLARRRRALEILRTSFRVCSPGIRTHARSISNVLAIISTAAGLHFKRILLHLNAARRAFQSPGASFESCSRELQ